MCNLNIEYHKSHDRATLDFEVDAKVEIEFEKKVRRG